MVSVTHSTVVTGSHNPNKQVSKNQWNEGHVITGTPGMVLGFDDDGNPTDIEALTEATADGLYSPVDHNHDSTYLKKASNLSDLANAATARDNLGLEIGADVQAYNASLMAAEWMPNFSDDGEVRIYASAAMTITEQSTSGTGSVAYAKSTAAAPSTFNSTTSPITLESGAWLKVTASSVSGTYAVALKRTA